MTMMPAKTGVSDTYPQPSNAIARAAFAQLWDAMYEATEKSEIDLASAATCDIGGQASMKLRITGTTGITSFGTNYRGPIFLRFTGAVTLTHNATTLRCPGGASITTGAADVLIAWPTATVSGALDGWQVAILGRGTVTDLPIADGGTGASTPATAFANLKQAASTSATGVVELATNAEAQTGTDTARAVTPDNLGAVVLGLGQTWQYLTASRAIGTTYTNSTGRSIQICVSGNASAVNSYMQMVIDGSNSFVTNGAYATGSLLALNGIVIPPGATYRVNVSSGSISSLGWWELR